MPNPKRSPWTNCSIAGMLGFFLMTGRRNQRTSTSASRIESVTENVASNDLNNSREIQFHNRFQQDRGNATEENSGRYMPSNTDNDDTEANDNPLRQISVRQWIIAAAVLIAVPVVAYLGTFYLYPYVQDLIEGESPIASVLAEYGVDEDAETQLLTIRRGDLVNSVAVNGTLEYANRERLSFAMAGTVDTIDIEIGDFLTEGEILMSLNDEAVVAAQQQLQNASVALQDAETALEDLVNPDQKTISDATLKVAKAQQDFATAEDALAKLIDPPATEIAEAELAVAEAIADLEAAQDKLADLLSPSDLDVGNAQLGVAEAEKTLADLTTELEDLTAQQSAAISAAEIAVGEATNVRDDALEAYEATLNIDGNAVNQAQLDLENEKLAVIEADAAVVDAENALLVANANVGNDITRKKLEISKVEAELAAATLALTEAQEALSDAQKPFDEEVVADLNAQIAEAEDDVVVAENQLARLAIEAGADVRKLESELYDAQVTYKNVFAKWLGMDISKYRWEYSPDQIFADVGKALDEIMDPATVSGGLAQRTMASSGWVEDDPATPWDEAIVATWTEFFLSELRFDCTEAENGINSTCVNLEFKDAWDDLLLKSEAYQTAKLADSQQLDSAEDAVASAEQALEDLEEQLEDEMTATDDEIINDLFAKQEVAYYTQVDVANRLELLYEELERVEQESKVGVAEAAQSLAVAIESAKVARGKLIDAEETLTDLQTGPDDVTVSVAYSKATKAEADLAEAIRELDNLRNLESPDNIVMHQRTYAANADLVDKSRALQTLLDGDEVAIALAQTEVTAAEEDLNDKLAALQDLVSPDEVDIEFARQELAVARADLAVALQEHTDLVNPDPATVALRRAEVATAREELDTARAATEGTQIIAPFDGVVADLQVEEGQSVNKDAIAVVMADPSIVEISGTVDEVDVLFLQVGDPASIELEALGDEALAGRISDIAAFGESEQGVVTYPVTIQTEQPSATQLPEGLSAVAEVVIREQTNKLLVPIQALFGSVNEPILLVSTDDDTLEPRNVTLGISDDFWTVIEDGVSEGETILMTVVGADTSQFGGFGAVRAFAGGGPPRR